MILIKYNAICYFLLDGVYYFSIILGHSFNRAINHQLIIIGFLLM